MRGMENLVAAIPFGDGAMAVPVGSAGDFPYSGDVDLAGGVLVGGEGDGGWGGVTGGGRDVGGAE